MSQRRVAIITTLVCAAMLACAEPSTRSTPSMPSAPDPSTPSAPSVAPPSMPSAAGYTWPGAPAGFQALSLPHAPDACDGRVVFVGVSAITMVPPVLASGAPDPSVPEGVEREAAALLGPMDLLATMSGAYNGPGGELHMRWQLGGESLVFAFDRRVSRQRFFATLRGTARQHTIVRLGGLDAAGQPACATLFLDTDSELDATYAGRVTPDGALWLDEPHVRLAGGPAPALPGEARDGLHLVELDADGEEPGAILIAVGLARWSDLRYPLLTPTSHADSSLGGLE